MQEHRKKYLMKRTFKNLNSVRLIADNTARANEE